MSSYQKGESQAFSVLLSRHQKPLFNYLFRFLKNEQAAEEGLQEVFFKVIKSRKRYRPSAKFTTWLYTMARHYCIDQSRKEKNRKLVPLEVSSDSDETVSLDKPFSVEPQAFSHFEAKELAKNLEEILVGLSPEQREVFELRQFQDMAFEEIAKVTQVSTNTVKSRMRYAVQAIQKKLEELKLFEKPNV